MDVLKQIKRPQDSLTFGGTLVQPTGSGSEVHDGFLDFQKSLDNEHDVGVMLTNFGSTMLMQVTAIGYEKSVLMVFKGYVDGRESTLIQHVSQLNFLLTSIPKAPDVPKRKIGFSVSPD